MTSFDIDKIEKTVEELAEPVVENLGFELVAVEFVEEEGEWYLRIYIDKAGGVDLDDCTNVSRILNEKIDEVDPIEQSYYFEVSSPGLDRPIKKEKDFIKYSGSKVRVILNKQIDGKEIFEGILIGLTNDEVIIKIKNIDKKLKRKDIKSVRLNDFG
ncbi:hypothetical protein Q428_03460, partial [Fervidicella metallireducens AeB]